MFTITQEQKEKIETLQEGRIRQQNTGTDIYSQSITALFTFIEKNPDISAIKKKLEDANKNYSTRLGELQEKGSISEPPLSLFIEDCENIIKIIGEIKKLLTQ